MKALPDLYEKVIATNANFELTEEPISISEGDFKAVLTDLNFSSADITEIEKGSEKLATDANQLLNVNENSYHEALNLAEKAFLLYPYHEWSLQIYTKALFLNAITYETDKLYTKFEFQSQQLLHRYPKNKLGLKIVSLYKQFKDSAVREKFSYLRSLNFRDFTRIFYAILPLVIILLPPGKLDAISQFPLFLKLSNSLNISVENILIIIAVVLMLIGILSIFIKIRRKKRVFDQKQINERLKIQKSTIAELLEWEEDNVFSSDLKRVKEVKKEIEALFVKAKLFMANVVENFPADNVNAPVKYELEKLLSFSNTVTFTDKYVFFYKCITLAHQFISSSEHAKTNEFWEEELSDLVTIYNHATVKYLAFLSVLEENGDSYNYDEFPELSTVNF